MSAMGRLFYFVTLYNEKGQTESDRVATTIQYRPFHPLYYHMDSSVTSKNEVDQGLLSRLQRIQPNR